MSKRSISPDDPNQDCPPMPVTLPVPVVVTSSDFPSKLPKLATPIPSLVSDHIIDLTDIPVPQHLEGTSSKNEKQHPTEETVTSNPQADINKQGDIKENGSKNCEAHTLKTAPKQHSWASSYLSSIGATYHKPIKINISSSVKSSEATTSELIHTPDNKNNNEDVLPVAETPNTVVTVHEPMCSTSGSDLFSGSLRHSIHPNWCSYEQPFYETTLSEFHGHRFLNYYRPAEDKSYFDKVDQFLAKISKDKESIEYRDDINTKKRSLSLNQRDNERNMNFVENDLQNNLVDFGSSRRYDDAPVNKYKKIEFTDKNASKSSRKLCDVEINKYSSTNQHDYYNWKKREYEYNQNRRTESSKFEDEYILRQNKKIQYDRSRAEYLREKIPNSTSNRETFEDDSRMSDNKYIQYNRCRAQYPQAKSPDKVHRYREMKIYKTRQRSNSSNSSDWDRSPNRNKHQNIIHKKVVSSDRYYDKPRQSIERSSNNHQSSDKKRRSRESSNISQKHCNKKEGSRERSNNNHKKCKKQSRERSTSSHKNYDDEVGTCKACTKCTSNCNSKISGSTEKMRKKSSCQPQNCQENKSTAKRRKYFSSSDSSPCHDSLTQGNKRYKIICGDSSCSSSSESDNDRSTSVRHSHKSNANDKYKTKKETKEKCNDMKMSENISNRGNESKNKTDNCDASLAFTKGYLSPDAKKTYKLIKDVISKDKMKRKLIKSLIFQKSSTNTNANNDKDNQTTSASHTKQITKTHETCKTKKHNEAEENKSCTSSLIKSAVLVKDNLCRERRSNRGESDMKNFDLRSILSRKNLHCETQNNNALDFQEMDRRENLVVTVKNQDSIGLDSNKTTEEKETEKLKTKKFKKIKLVINLICEDSDEQTVKRSCKQNDIDTTNVDKGSALSSEELSFLDDLNIDEIVDSLTHNKDESELPESSANPTIENKALIDLCDLTSSTEDSDASTVHLEELHERHDNCKDFYKSNKSDSSENNTRLQKKRADMKYEKINCIDLSQAFILNNVTPDDNKLLNQDTQAVKRKIKEEMSDNDIDNTYNLNTQTESRIQANTTISQINNKQVNNFILNANEIKKEEVENKEIYEKIKLEEERNDKSTNKPDVKENTDSFKLNNIIPLIEIKDEPIDLDRDNTIPVIEIKDEPAEKFRTNSSSLLDGKTNHDQMKNEKADTNQRSLKNIPVQIMKKSNSCLRDQNGNMHTLLIEIEDESAVNIEEKNVDMLSDLDVVPANEIKTEVCDEDANKNLPCPTSLPIVVNISHPIDSKENTTKNYTEEGKDCSGTAFEIKIENPDSLENIDKKITGIIDVFRNKSECNSKNIIANNYTIAKVNETIKENGVTKSDKVINFDADLVQTKEPANFVKIEKIDETYATIPNPAISTTCAENFQSGILNKSDSQIPKTVLRNNQFNKNTNNSSKAVSYYTTNIPKESFKITKEKTTSEQSSVIRTARNENHDDKVSETSKPDNYKQINKINSSSTKTVSNQNANISRKLPEKMTENNIIDNSTSKQSSLVMSTAKSEKSINKHISFKPDYYKQLNKTNNVSMKAVSNLKTNVPIKIPDKVTEDGTLEYKSSGKVVSTARCENVINKIETSLKPDHYTQLNKTDNISIKALSNLKTNNPIKVPDKVTEDSILEDKSSGTVVSTARSEISNNEVKSSILNNYNQLNKIDSSKKTVSYRKTNVQSKTTEKNIEDNTLENKLSEKSSITSTDRSEKSNDEFSKSSKTNIKIDEKKDTRGTKINNTNFKAGTTISLLSPIRIKTTEPINKIEKKPEWKYRLENIEERLLQYLQEPHKVNSLIHKGKFSKIFHCKSVSGKDLVVKMLRYEKDCCFKGITKQRFLESLQLDIPEENLNFVRVSGGLAVSGLWCLLMDFYPKNLSQYFEENGKSLHVDHVQHLSRQLVAAVMTLRHMNVVHSDIKPSHVLLNSTNDKLKLCGFDSAYHIGQIDPLPNIGSVNYRAPEIILGFSAGYSIDVWSTALVMFEMATRRHLFPGFINNDILFKQMCTVGYVTFDMVSQSRFGHFHFTRMMFKRRIYGQPYTYTLLDERSIYNNNILQSTIFTTYHKEWAKNIPKTQKDAELDKISRFCELLKDMLKIHPKTRMPIEFVYAHPYLFDANKDMQLI